MCVLIQLLTAEFPGGSKVSRESMIYTVSACVRVCVFVCVCACVCVYKQPIASAFQSALRFSQQK